MARKTKKSPLFLKEDQLQELNRISQSRTAPAQETQRAKILLSYYENPIISKVARTVGVVRDTVYKCIDKALEMGVEKALKDLYHCPKEPTITMEAKAWLVNIACRKMKELLLVSQEVHLQNDSQNTDDKKQVYTVCVDEKPGVQAIANVAPDLPPQPKLYPRIARDHEYKRLGTASILAGIDLHDGHVFAQVQHRHRSSEFIGLLEEIDARYPLDAQIRIILDNHSTHISKETRAYLAARPGRFIYVHTPKHGSWLNLAETVFSKMARTFLRHIRVSSWGELKKRILLGVQELNEQPVVHRWRKFESLKN